MSLKGMPRNHLTFTREETLPSMYMRSGVNTRGGVSVYVIQNEILLLIREGNRHTGLVTPARSFSIMSPSGVLGTNTAVS